MRTQLAAKIAVGIATVLTAGAASMGASAAAQSDPWRISAGDSLEFPIQPAWLEIASDGKLDNLTIETIEGALIAPTGEAEQSGNGTKVHLPLLHDGIYSLTWTDKAGDNYAELAILNPANGAPITGEESSLAGSDTQELGQEEATSNSVLYIAAGALILVGAGGTAALLVRRRGIVSIVPLAGSMLIAGAAAAVTYLGTPDAASDPLGAQVEGCATNGNKVECLREAIYTTFTDQGPQATGQLLERTQKTPGLIDGSSDQPCHTAAHKVGQALASSDYPPSDIVNDYMYSCGFGVGHGWLEGRAAYLTDEEAARELPGTCDSISNETIRNACMHGIGHASGWRYNNEPTQTLAVCLGIPADQDVYQCAQGAGMNMALGYKSALARDQKFDPERQARNTAPLLIQACEGLPAAAMGGCFDGAYTYMISYGNLNLAALLPEDGTAAAARQWCETHPVESDTYQSCVFGLGSGIVDTYNYQTYDQQVQECAKLENTNGQLLCIWGAKMRLGALPGGAAEVDSAIQEELCGALEQSQECLDFLARAPLRPPALMPQRELNALLAGETVNLT